jgi:hypothetical protein
METRRCLSAERENIERLEKARTVSKKEKRFGPLFWSASYLECGDLSPLSAREQSADKSAHSKRETLWASYLECGDLSPLSARENKALTGQRTPKEKRFGLFVWSVL